MKKFILTLSFLVSFGFACHYGAAFEAIHPAHQSGKSLITESKAKEIAMQKVKGEVVSCYLEEEAGRQVYGIRINHAGTLFEIEVDALTGKVLEVEKRDSGTGNK